MTRNPWVRVAGWVALGIVGFMVLQLWDTTSVLSWLAVLLALYMLPTIVAWRRKHPQLVAIAALNVLAGWTLIGWVGAIVWSLMKYDRAVAR